MAGSDTTTRLDVATRSVDGSRAARRLRRTGRVPGVLYGGDGDPVALEVDARILRNTLAHAHAVIELSVDGSDPQPVMLKDTQRHPVRGEILHADFLRVDLRKPIQATVSLEITGGDEAPGVVEGGVLNQEARELNVEALPGDIPDRMSIDVSGMEMNDTLYLNVLTPPPGVTLLDDPDETVVATITPPTQEPVEEEIETETELVGEEGEAVEAEGDTGKEAEAAAGSESAPEE
jgi:large subunit ribosomal protein L25